MDNPCDIVTVSRELLIPSSRGGYGGNGSINIEIYQYFTIIKLSRYLILKYWIYRYEETNNAFKKLTDGTVHFIECKV